MTVTLNWRISWFLQFVCILPGSFLFEVKLKPLNQEKVIRPLGMNLVSTCEVVGDVDSSLRIQWFDQNKKEVMENVGTTGSMRVYVERDGPRVRKLYVSRIEKGDAGRFSCMVHANNQNRDKFFELALFKEITFDDAPLSQHPAVHKDALIRCQVSGEPVPIVSWKFNSTVAIGSEGRGRYVVEKRGLLVKNITQADNGFYTCRAEVEADGRYDERKILVVVHVPPKVTRSIGQVNGTEGEPANVSCNATGFPHPMFTFLKNGKVIKRTERIEIREELGRVSFKPLLKEDEGVYVCRANNDVGEDVGNGSLKVFVPPKITEYRNITKNEVETGVLTCRSQGDPKPDMTFRKEGSREDFKLGQHEGDRIHVTQKSPGHLELVIRRLVPSDRSGYFCISKNKVGTDEVLGFIDVQYKPGFAADQIKKSHSWSGRVHNITCSVEANPPATIQWVRYDRILENNDTYRIFQIKDGSNLQVRVKDSDQSWIYGIYKCTAKNSKGDNVHAIELHRADVPDKPKVAALELTANTVTLRADPPMNNGGMEVIGYRVVHGRAIHDYSINRSSDSHYRKSSSDLKYPGSWSTDRAYSNHSATDLKIENLRPNTKYSFKVMAKNEVGVGPSVEITLSTTDKSKPFAIRVSSPQQGSNSYQYEITWEKPKTGGLPITKYEIKYRKAALQTKPGSIGNTLNDAEQQRAVPGAWVVVTHHDEPSQPSLSHVITGLDPLTNYEVEVYAHNSLGRSEAGPFFQFKTNEVRYASSSRANVSNYIQLHLVLQLVISLLCLKN